MKSDKRESAKIVITTSSEQNFAKNFSLKVAAHALKPSALLYMYYSGEVKKTEQNSAE